MFSWTVGGVRPFYVAAFTSMLVISARAWADTTISVGSSGTGLSGGVSSGSGPAGESFKVPLLDSRLASWTFWLGNESSSSVDIVFHVDSLYNSGLPGGPNYPYGSLYVSPVLTMTSFEGNSGTGVPKTWSNLNLDLNPGGDYIAYISWVSGGGGVTHPVAFGNQGSNPYPDGWPLGLNPSNGYWIGNPAGDYAFTANFVPAPEPSGLLLVGVGVIGLMGLRERRSIVK